MILYHVTTCSKLDKILKEGLLVQKEALAIQGLKGSNVLWFTDKAGIGIVARYWVRSDICVIKCSIPDSYVKVEGITYYGPSEYAKEYYIRTKFKLKWITDTWKYTYGELRQ
jgi:hypothetical protein